MLQCVELLPWHIGELAIWLLPKFVFQFLILFNFRQTPTYLALSLICLLLSIKFAEYGLLSCVFGFIQISFLVPFAGHIFLILASDFLIFVLKLWSFNIREDSLIYIIRSEMTGGSFLYSLSECEIYFSWLPFRPQIYFLGNPVWSLL